MAVVSEDHEDFYENAPCGYLSMRLDGRILRVNATLARWIGCTPEQVAGKRLHDLLTIGARILYETSFAPLLSMQDGFEEASLDLRTFQGEILAVCASANVRRQVDGQPLWVRVAFFKVAERRRYERQLVDAREQSEGAARDTKGLLESARETSDLREQFIAVLGHDLRNPLTAISGGVQLLRREPPADRRKRLLDMLEGSVARMAGLIDNVLDFARGRLGAGIPLDLRRDVLLLPIVEQVVAELRLGFPDRRIEVELDVTAPVKCDPSRIGQLVSNLLGNALTHGAPDMPVRIHADETDGVLTVWIANGGKELPASAIDRLFQPFFRGEVRDSQQGLGLGLYIASEIAKAHGGMLAATSTPKETRFTFRMPAAGR